MANDGTALDGVVHYAVGTLRARSCRETSGRIEGGTGGGMGGEGMGETPLIIKAFNSDKPYAEFVREQVAGDALEPEIRNRCRHCFLARRP